MTWNPLSIEYMKKFLPMYKDNKVKTVTTAFILTVLAVFTSCSGDKEINYEYFVSKESVASYSLSYINTLLDGAEGFLPEIGPVRSYV